MIKGPSSPYGNVQSLARAITRPLIMALLFSMVVVIQTYGASPTVGVKAGDWAHYDVNQHVVGNSTLAKTTEKMYSSYNSTNYVSLNITSVNSTNVTLTQGIHHANGTVTVISTTVDVSLGIDPSNPPLIIMQSYPPTLSSITTGNFSGIPRTIDNLVVNSQVVGNSSALRYSWDNVTGILLSEQFAYTFDASSTNNATFTYTLAMTSTSLWRYVPPKPPASHPSPGAFDQQFAELYALVGITAAVGLGVIAYARRKPPKASNSVKRRRRMLSQLWRYHV